MSGDNVVVAPVGGGELSAADERLLSICRASTSAAAAAAATSYHFNNTHLRHRSLSHTQTLFFECNQSISVFSLYNNNVMHLFTALPLIILQDNGTKTRV